MVNLSAVSGMFNAAGIPYDVDFHALDWHQVEALVEMSKVLKYRVPKNANGSRARYFYQAVVREKNRKK